MDATHKSSIHYLVGATDALPQRGLNPVARENRRVLDTSTQYRGRELTKSASCPDFRTSSRSTPQTSLLKFKKTTSPGPPVTSEENGKQSKSKNRQVRHAICVMCNLQDLIASRAHPNNAPASSRSFVPPDPASYGIGSAEKSGFYSEDEMPSPCKYKTLKIKKSKMRQTSKKHTKIEHPTADVIWTWSETENQLDDYGRPKGWLHRKLRTM
ncbi:hypothetical protein SISSUDRAFT_432279 [Sistotremastrum suecicum HHB10207 ss-3]|uniref:Uncharacterized protein n=1 Tax=Sistotremastrum suecicum HHB10207 ss-3 TaxID=1314776 RepID=A0A165YH20_9AGAM|nr:hypothetical protein SISSUDRAFT_432279 [Sistotremastrum suecicum HHB10207 ss-3]